MSEQIRKLAYSEIRTSTLEGAASWYISSLSHKTLVYKGMLTTLQLEPYFTDLRDPLRSDASDEEIAELIAKVWTRRADRYSEIRTAETAKQRKVEMSYIGG